MQNNHMSVRAGLAYNRGERPWNEWKKSDIAKIIAERSHRSYKSLCKCKAEDLKNEYLEYSSWHHIENYDNKVKFYKIKEVIINDKIYDN